MALNIFVDSSFIVALSLRKDVNHKNALKLIRKYSEDVYCINDLIVYESINVLCRLGGIQKARKFNQSVEQERYTQLNVSKEIWKKCFINIIKKYSKAGPNVFDHIHFACMSEYGLTNVLTFDHHFSSAGFNILK